MMTVLRETRTTTFSACISKFLARSKLQCAISLLGLLGSNCSGVRFIQQVIRPQIVDPLLSHRGIRNILGLNFTAAKISHTNSKYFVKKKTCEHFQRGEFNK